jgi:hypothetical protein
MHYELYDELRHSEEIQKPIPLQLLINKSYLDAFYDLRSEIFPIYDRKKDLDRLIQNSYPYLLTQKIIHGIAKAIFLGLDPACWESSIFLPSGRMSVPAEEMHISPGQPCLYFQSDKITYDQSVLQLWENAYLELAPHLAKEFGIQISADGFRAQLYRILEILFSYRSERTKRSAWVIFLHELIIHGKQFDISNIQEGFSSTIIEKRVLIKDENFKTLPYLEYTHNQSLGEISTLSDKKLFPDAGSLKIYSHLNQSLLGKIPMCHFSIGELMFIAKDEYKMNQYYEWYVRPWTDSKEVEIYYLDNDLRSQRMSLIQDFPAVLRTSKYALVLGFKANGFYYSAEPKMLKD